MNLKENPLILFFLSSQLNEFYQKYKCGENVLNFIKSANYNQILFNIEDLYVIHIKTYRHLFGQILYEIPMEIFEEGKANISETNYILFHYALMYKNFVLDYDHAEHILDLDSYMNLYFPYNSWNTIVILSICKFKEYEIWNQGGKEPKWDIIMAKRK